MNTQMFGDNLNDDASGLPPVRMEPALVTAPPSPKNRVQATEGVATYAEDRVKIVLEDNDEIPPTGQFIGVDGVGYMLKPNLPAVVPLAVVEVLDNAVASKPVVDPETKQIVNYANRLRFPYRVLARIPKGTPVDLAA